MTSDADKKGNKAEFTAGGVKRASAQAQLPVTRGVQATPEGRRSMIAEAAYYMAEARGFATGHEVDDWLVAERQIDSSLTGGSRVTAAVRPA